jgi:hypothetical protein
MEWPVEKSGILDLDGLGGHRISWIDIEAEDHLGPLDLGGNAEPDPGVERSTAKDLPSLRSQR